MKPAERVAYIAFLLFLLCIYVSAASAQMMSTGIGGGGFGGGAAPAYTGPGDVSGWSTQYAMYSFRCNKTAYTGNVAAIRNVATPSTTTLLTCSSGGTVNQTVNPLSTTCATNCEMTTWYDQSGNGRNLVAGSGGLPLAVPSSFAGQISAFFNSGEILALSGVSTAQAQPISIAAATLIKGVGIVVGNDGFSFQALGAIVANNRFQAAGGSRVDYSGTDNTLESIVSVLNGASSSVKVNGGAITSNGDPGSTGITSAGSLAIGAASIGAAYLTGNVYEVIITAGARNSTEQNAIVANQRTIGTGW